MKYIFFFFFITLVACSPQNIIQQNVSSKPHKPEWFGASEQKIVERFGQPTEYLIDTILKGKKYIYVKKTENVFKLDEIKLLSDKKIEDFIRTNYITYLIIFQIDSNNIVNNSFFYNNKTYNPSYLYFKDRDALLKRD